MKRNVFPFPPFAMCRSSFEVQQVCVVEQGKTVCDLQAIFCNLLF